MTTTNTTYKVKELISNWTSCSYDSLEEAQNNLKRLRDRVNMVEWKTRPTHNYVVVQEEVVNTHTVISSNQ